MYAARQAGSPRKGRMIEDGAPAVLLNRIKQEDSAAFDELFKAYEPLLRSLVAGYSVGCPDTDELYRAALLALYRAARSYRGEQAGVTFGLYAKICMENALNTQCSAYKARMEKEFPVSPEHLEEQGTADDPAVSVMREEALESLRSRIRQILSPYENRIWNLHMVGYRNGEIAEALGRSPRSVENAVYRIRAKLRAALGH